MEAIWIGLVLMKTFNYNIKEDYDIHLYSNKII